MRSGASLGSQRQAGVYVWPHPQGEKPGDLPVMQRTIDLKAAKTLDLLVPLSLLGRADEVIE